MEKKKPKCYEVDNNNRKNVSPRRNQEIKNDRKIEREIEERIDIRQSWSDASIFITLVLSRYQTIDLIWRFLFLVRSQVVPIMQLLSDTQPNSRHVMTPKINQLRIKWSMQ